LRKTEYDLDSSAQLVRRTSYPHADFFAERAILHPPSESEMLATFGQAQA